MKAKLLFICLIFASSALGQPYAGKTFEKQTISKAAGCVPPSTSTLLDLNNVSALIHTAGNLWQVPGQNLAHYEVPKNSGVMALFTSALWLGGTDVNNQLKLAALRYRNGQDYWTGPLSQGAAETTYDNCAKYDRHFITVQDEIREFDAWFNAGIEDAENGTNIQSTTYPNYEVPLVIKEWPAHGDISQGQDYYLAPFYDRNEDGNYNWEDGDYPWHDITKTKECKVDRRVSLFGDLNFWWIMNDKGNIHTETNADPIGMEIRAQAFAFASNDEVNNMTFYNYELINRGTQTLQDTYFGCFTDGALGDPNDDYVGCDVNRGLAYYYNGDNFDGDNAGYLGYGDNPPAVGVDFFEGPYQDDDGIDNAFGIGSGEALNGIGYGDGIIDNERYGMRRFLYYSNSGQGANPSQTDPSSAADYYNYLKGFWKDGTPFYYGGSGHISDAEADPNIACDFMFPGDTDPLGWGTGGIPQDVWTEQTANNPADDRRFVQSAGPFVLKPGSVNNITVGVAWARASGGDPFASVEALQRADDKAQALFENCFRVLDAPHAPVMEIQELENELILTLSNSVNSNNYNEQYIEFDPFIVVPDSSADLNYRFQGYQIFQLSGDDVSLSDLEDPTKARLAAQCDIEDDIDRIINFEFDEGLGASIPVEKVNGENKGIRHSFLITEDLFASGDKQLVNFKTYYFVAIAYSHNNFKEYDPTDPLALDGQQKKYLSSRKAASSEVKIVAGMPHNPKPEASGTGQNIEYGSTPRIKRLDGYGNGGRVLELTQESTNQILSNGFLDTPTYRYGNGPINVKVVDPLNVADGYFECKFHSYSTSSSNGADTASWTIYHYSSEGGSLIDSVSSELAISMNNEQIIAKWGVSVQINQENYYLPDGGAGGIEGRTTDLLDATISFTDSSKIWLSFVQDNDAFFPTNWIRSGDYSPTDPDDCLPNELPYLNPCNYRDQNGADNDKVFAGMLEGGIAPHRVVGYEEDYMPIAYYNFTSATTAKKNSSISFMPSVDIVFTNDKSKWTRCPVIELGRDNALNVGNAEPGQMRKSSSVGKDGLPDNSGTTGMGWFPGYAIDIESGARLYMAFGENSFLGNENGADMIWNPTDRLVDGVGTPLMGGMHPVYVYTYKNRTLNNYLPAYDYEAYSSASENLANHRLYQDQLLVDANDPLTKHKMYGCLGWIAYPILTAGADLLETDVSIRLRVNKEYKNFSATGLNQGRPMYSWNMDEISTELGSADRLAEALKLINVVPNPYNAYSEYENNRLDTRVRITNLPEVCTVSIYTINGKLVRKFKKSSIQTFIDWNLTNHAKVPISGGVYLIHVDVPGIGQRVLKSFIAMRQVDMQNL
ncbi:MAG: T9SS C-terminal target domain-containing protein [Crocinitomicaceae bacterium]|nr:T9SS C-terminal target domain-containing protein [Crocinitomicaceae bacterium]